MSARLEARRAEREAEEDDAKVAAFLRRKELMQRGAPNPHGFMDVRNVTMWRRRNEAERQRNQRARQRVAGEEGT